MTIKSKILVAATAALVLQVPVLAQHDHNHGHGTSCPHAAATEKSVDHALALLEQAKANPTAAGVEKALTALREAKGHMGECKEMCSKMEGHDHTGHAANQVTDPVCGMAMDPKTAAAKSIYAGKAYYFCSQENKESFDRNPEAFLRKG